MMNHGMMLHDITGSFRSPKTGDYGYYGMINDDGVKVMAW